MLNNENRLKYWDGWLNRVIRYVFYVQKGLAFVNEFKYIIVAIVGFCLLLKISNPFVMVLAFFVSLPLLGIVGWFLVFKMGKVIEFLNTEFSSHWSRYGFDLSERQLKNLDEINAEIKNIKKIVDKKI